MERKTFDKMERKTFGKIDGKELVELKKEVCT